VPAGWTICCGVRFDDNLHAAPDRPGIFADLHEQFGLDSPAAGYTGFSVFARMRQNAIKKFPVKILWQSLMPDLERIQVGVPDTCDDCRIIIKIPAGFVCRIHAIENEFNSAIRCFATHNNFSLFGQVLDIFPVVLHSGSLFLCHGREKIRALWPEQGYKICCLTHTLDCLPSAVIGMGPLQRLQQQL